MLSTIMCTVSMHTVLYISTVAGHVPMLANPAYADLVHAIGVASLGADDKMIW